MTTVGDAEKSPQLSVKLVDTPEFVSTPKERGRILKKIDLRVTIVCGVLYFISLLDRGNLGYANINGMSSELELTVSNRYNIVALVFFAPYILFQFPATLFARKIGVRVFISLICVIWGVVLLCQGVVQTWKQLAALRVLLGAFEAAYFPVAVYLMSTWYIRFELQKRYATFWLISCIASGFGGILAFGIGKMAGISHMAGWRWIFILEGGFTSVLGFLSYFALVEFPENAHRCFKFLKQEEIESTMQRIDEDRGDAKPEPFSLANFIAAGKDLKLWLLGLIFCCLTTVNYSVSFFLPVILRQMGFSTAKAQLLTAPPFVLAGLLCVSCGWIGDRYHIRGPLIIGNALICLTGIFIAVYCHNTGVRYFGLFLLAAGGNANVPTAMAYQANNIYGQWARAFGSATLVALGGIGGFAGSLVFRSQDAPRYLPGFYACMAANALIIVIVLGHSVYFYRQNRQIREGKKMIGGQEGLYYTY